MMDEDVAFLRLDNVRMAAAQPLRITHKLDDSEMRPDDVENDASYSQQSSKHQWRMRDVS